MSLQRRRRSRSRRPLNRLVSVGQDAYRVYRFGRPLIDPLVRSLTTKRSSKKRKRETDDPARDDGQKVSAFTTLASTHACVFLGGCKLKGWKPCKVDKASMMADKKLVFTGTRVIESAINKKLFFPLFVGYQSAYPPTVGTVANTTYLTPGGTQETNIGFNDVFKMDYINRTSSVMESAVTMPTYGAGGIGVTTPGAITRRVVLRNQWLELKLKNLTSPAAGVSNASDSPVYLTLYCVKLKKDIYAEFSNAAIPSGGNVDGPFQFQFLNGFERKYEDDGGGNAQTMDYQQYYPTFMNDNTFFKEYCEVAYKKEFNLNVGVEGTFRFTLPEKQLLSFSHYGRAKCFGATSADYAPVLYRKGEYRFLLLQHGGLSGAVILETDTQTNSMHIQNTKIGVWATHGFTFNEVYATEKSEKKYATAPAANYGEKDVDADQGFK